MSIGFIDQPTVAVTRPELPEWGSDIVVEMLRRLGVEYAALNPGASFRGLHDSIVNFGGNRQPGMIICNHEEVAVAVAHGYAKAGGKPMAAILHSNVGLLHGSMAMFNAWCDRVPVFVLGATGPMDSTRRRPWIDWIHTSHGQGGVVRDFTKWEHQPSSVEAIPEAMLRAWQAMQTEPAGPVYVCLDAGLQEQRLTADRPIRLPDARRYPLAGAIEPAREAVAQAARWLVEAEFPVLLPGRVGRDEQAWRNLVSLAESLGSAVLIDLKSRASFPTAHPLSQAGPSVRPGQDAVEILRRADLVLALERIDPAGVLRTADLAGGDEPPDIATTATRPRLINVSLEPLASRSWSGDFQELPAADLPIVANAERFVAALVEEVERQLADNPTARSRAGARLAAHLARRGQLEAGWAETRQRRWDQTPISIIRLAAELRTALGERFEQAVLTRSPLSWPPGVWDFQEPGSYLGSDGGAGIGSGPGMSVGAAMALRDSGRPVVAVLGDGDLLMAPMALWTAAHHQVPLMIVVANNRSYFNDEEHQERVAVTRDRPVENRWVGQRIDDPPIDFAGLARDLGVEGFGPVTDPADLPAVYSAALAALDEGRPALVDVRIAPR